MKSGIIIALMAFGIGFAASARVTFTTLTSADVFLASGSPANPTGEDLSGLNFGGAGTLVVSPASSVKGEFQSVIRFNVTNALSLFDSTYGAGHWSISGISLELTSNYGTDGVQPNNPIFNVVHHGNFIIEWLAADDWMEGTGNPNLPTTDGLTLSMLPGLLAQPHVALVTNTYNPPGNNIHVTWPLPLQPDLVADVAAGGDVSFLFHAADEQVNYLFNSYYYGRGNEPLIHVTAVPKIEILSGNFADGLFHLTATGATNAQYQIQAASGLAPANWQVLGTVSSDDAGAIQFDDPTALGQPQRFYRLVWDAASP